MKALVLLADTADNGGIQRFNRLFCRAMAEEFSNSDFVALSLHDPRGYKAVDARNVTTVCCGRFRPALLRKVIFAVKAISHAIAKKPDVIICGHVDLSGLALAAKRFYGIRYIVLTHGVDVWTLKSGLKYAGLKYADKIFAVSEYTKRRMVENGIPAARVGILHNAVDTGYFRPAPPDKTLAARLGLEGRKAILTVGRMVKSERYKGHDTILRALALLPDAYIWIVAGEGDDADRLRAEAGKHGLGRRVRFVGRVADSELICYYNLCDCFVMPSRGEGFGIVFLEAMACGRPVIGGNSDGCAEPIRDGQLGFLVDPDDERELAETITRACRHDEEKTSPEILPAMAEKYFGIGTFRATVKALLREFLSV
ncbi:MAG: glycosyltransferase family 4 protein [Candidatus Omnitrophota bacterium]